jgi:hypothetical protein
MKTPTLNLTTQSQQLRYHSPAGQSRQLEVALDGQIENAPQQDEVVRSADDPRLMSGKMGSGWVYSYQGGEHLRLGDLQQVRFGEQGQVEVTTRHDGVEHRLSGQRQEGQLQDLKESVQLEVSAAGLPVYLNDQILWDMPSAYTGGCTW